MLKLFPSPGMGWNGTLTVVALATCSPVSHDDHFLLQYTLEITGWVILWRYKMAISDRDSFLTIVVLDKVARANNNKRF
jgi:hypothetical protein